MTLRTAQKPKLETRLALIEQRVNDLVERHETVPGRVTRLEGEFEHMGAQLAALNDGQRELTATVADIGTKVTRMLAALTVLGVVAQALGPTLFRMLFP
ncbi:hypothetical protein [Pseudomonas monteilii]|uniref:Uncharacterized protein n=1 Tax=Pseudomonas monteilii TaxID=76759 RepID=A0AAP7FPF9_9PSED|nr:hypothetical protein [Pseudomonas monteilii]MCE0874100.1 hypothetical protein [Pseudomonas monteilii]OAH52421.1 hypothetical protein AYJ70_07635 [Pseudomonas monteilii]